MGSSAAGTPARGRPEFLGLLLDVNSRDTAAHQVIGKLGGTSSEFLRNMRQRSRRRMSAPGSVSSSARKTTSGGTCSPRSARTKLSTLSLGSASWPWPELLRKETCRVHSR